MEAPRLWKTSLHNLLAHILLSIVPPSIPSQGADVRAIVATRKATVAKEESQCGVSIYKLSSKTPWYNSSTHILSICSGAPFEKKWPRYVYPKGPMSFAMHVEIFS